MGIDARYLQDKNKNRFYPYTHADASFDRNGIKVGVRLDDLEMSISSAIITAKNYTDLKISDLIDGAPETLDTLKEIADVLADNEDVMNALNSAIALKANASDLTAHIENNVAHITAVERLNWNLAKTHADSQHAPGNAEPNQNAYSNIRIGTTIIAADSKMDTLTFENGENIQFSLDAINNKINISASHSHTGLSSTGNSDSTTKLATARKINGTLFDGTQDITTGNWGTTRSFTIGTASKNINGSANIVWTMAELGLDKVNNTADSSKNVATANQVNGTYTGNGGQQSPSYVTSGKTRFNMWNGFKGITNPAGGYMDVILMDNYTGSDVPYVTGIGVTKNNGNPRMFIANGAKGGTGNWAYQVEAITTANIASQSVASATTATKLGTNAGSATQPVYFSGGKPVACTYTLSKSVPSNAVFTDTNTWKANTKDQEGYVAKGSGQANKVWKTDANGNPGWRDDANSTGYLPLTGGTMTGKIQAPTVGGSWISGMTLSNATLGITTKNSSGSYHPIIACKTYNNHIWNLGTITDTVGLYGFKSGRTANGTDWSFTINVTNGAVSSTGGITAPTFNGAASKLGTSTVGSASKPIYLNAGTATACSTTIGSSTRPMYSNAGTLTAVSYVAIAYGGTGSTSATGARTNLGAVNIVSQTTEPSTQNIGDIWLYEC